MKIIKYSIVKILSVSVLVFLNVSCTKYDNPVGVFDEINTEVDSTIQKKVMFINVEGAVGQEVKDIMPPTIEEMMANSKYTWTGLSEANSNDATTWASQLTGVYAEKHEIMDSSFIANTGLNNTQANIPYFPTIFHQVNTVNPALTSLAVTSWDPLSEGLFTYANERIVVSSDEEAKNTVINELESSDFALNVVGFRGVLNAGLQNGFSKENSGYVEALNTVDGYIGEVLTAIEQRETYEEEEWLVIVSSNHGGIETTYGGSSEPERNTFSMFYHPDYESLELESEKLLTTSFNNDVVAVAQDDEGLLELGDGDLTIEAHIKVNPLSDGSYDYGNWNRILGKDSWGIYRAFNGTDLRVNIDQEGGAVQLGMGNTFSDGLWHSVVVVITTQPEMDTRTFKMYYDGALMTTVVSEVFGGALTDLGDFVVGGSGVDFNIAEIRIWDSALSDFQIAENACLPEIPEDHREYNHLIGYWPAQTEGDIFENKIDGSPDLVIENRREFITSTNSLPCNLGPGDVSVENVSIPPQIFYWLDIPVDDTWLLDGNVFLDSFSLEVEVEEENQERES